MKSNSDFDKRTRACFPSCWDQHGHLLPWETYETSVVEEKRKIGSTHERTTILKGETIVNYLQMDFKFLWLMRTLFIDKPTHRRITSFRMTHTRFVKSPSLNVAMWKKCRGWMPPTTTSAEEGPSSPPQSQITK